ncbi:MAG: archaellin/type IV pilin N-terminal domain-containing protein [Thermoplasmata archaeon]
MKRAWIVRKNEEAVSPVIATILMVAITVVLAAVLYVMVSGLITTTAAEPNVQLAAPESVSSTLWEVKIAGVSETKGLSNFMAVLVRNGTNSESFDPIADGSNGANMVFEDLDGGGTLSVGDYFRITVVALSDYKLSIVWKDSGNERGNTDWQT